MYQYIALRIADPMFHSLTYSVFSLFSDGLHDLKKRRLMQSCLLLLVLLSMPAVADQQVLRVGVYHNPPKIFLSNADGTDAQMSGFFGDLLREIAQREQWHIEAVECEWSDCLAQLERGDLDLLPDVAMTTERKHRFAFHQIPALHSWSQVFSHTSVELDSVLDLQDKRIAVLEGSVQYDYLQQLVEKFNLNTQWIIIDSLQQGLELVKTLDADGLATNNLFGGYHAQAYQLKPTAVIFQPAEVYFAGPQNQSQIPLERINAWLSEWSNDPNSPYLQILQGWKAPETQFVTPRSVWILSSALILALLILLFGIRRLKGEIHLTRDELRKSDDKFTTLVSAQKEEVHQLNYYDPLTGLANRRQFIERLNLVLSELKTSPQQGAILLLDIDSFRNLNDTLGHQFGDQLLIHVADRLKRHHQNHENLARFGGDEFMIILENLSDDTAQLVNQVEITVDRLNQSFKRAFTIQGQDITTSICFGIVTFSSKNRSADELIQKAELALFDAKKSGRRQIKFFDHEMQAQAEQHTQYEIGLGYALKNNELTLHYQPQYKANQIVGVEALIRWQPKGGKMISPAQFIPIAEHSGLIIPIGEWVITEACKTLACWSKQANTQHLTMAVNISAVQMRQKEFVDQVVRIIDQTQAPASQLEFELTESLLIDNSEDTINKIIQLKALGISFSLDDFGTGYSSLSMLTRFPLDTLKVDQSFVRDMHRDARDYNVVKAIVELGRGLNLNVIAEGVETEQQKEALLKLGCYHFQGFLFSKPLPLENLNMDT